MTEALNKKVQKSMVQKESNPWALSMNTSFNLY